MDTAEGAARAPEIAAGPVSSGVSVFASRNFRLFFTGQLISNTGNWLQLVAQSILVKELSGSSFVVGLVNAALFLPVWFFALPGGRLADRFDRRQVLIATQVLAAVATGVLAVLAGLDRATVPVVVVVALLVGVQAAISIPTMQALLPSLVEPGQLGQAIGMNAITYNVGRVLGPAIAAAIVATLGFGLSFGLNSLSFAGLVVALLLIRPRAVERGAVGEGPIREALAYAWRERRARLMLLGVSCVAVAMAPMITLLPTFARNVFHEGTASAGLLMSGFGLGAILAAFGLTRAYRSAEGARFGLLLPGAFAFAGGLAAFALSPTFAVGAVSLAVAGAGFTLVQVTWTTGIQQEVPESLRGRVMGLWTLAFLGVWPVAGPVGGALADLAGARVAVLAALAPAFLVAIAGARTLPRAGSRPGSAQQADV